MPRRRRKRALVLAAVGLLAPVSLCYAQPAPANNLPQIVTGLVDDYLKRDVASLLNGTQPERDDAARRLIARQTPAGRAAVSDALLRKDNPSAQLAAAKAIAEDPSPDPALIGPLADLLPDRLSEAATAALLNYRQEEAVRRIRTFVTDQRNVRTAAIRTLGQSTDIRIAAILIDLVQRDPNKANFAADALVDMTQLPENGRDPAAWVAWWAANGAKPAEQFQAELERARRRKPVALADLDGLVTRLYQLANDKDKPEALKRILESVDAPIRAAGVRLAFQVFNGTGRLPPGIQDKVRELLRDPLPEVRSEVARALQKTNDRPMLMQILAQLRIETDVEAKIALILAVEPMADPRALPELIRLLSDPSLRIATVSAETIAKLGREIRKDPILTREAIEALNRATRDRGAQDSSGNFRAACIEALVPLSDPAQRDNFLRLLDARQPPRLRKAALAGLGVIRNLEDARAIFDIVLYDKDNGVRVAAIGAIEKLSPVAYAIALFDIAQKAGEDDDVRKAARRAFESLLPQVSEPQLDGWSKRLLDLGDHDARIPVLKEKIARVRTDPKRTQELAATLESLGDAFYRISQPQQAIAPLQEALGIWEKLNAANSVTSVRRRLLEAYLAAKLYPAAVKLAQDAIDRDPANQPDVVPVLINEVERLNKTNQKSDARTLATESLSKLRTLEERYRKLLTLGRTDAGDR